MRPSFAAGFAVAALACHDPSPVSAPASVASAPTSLGHSAPPASAPPGTAPAPEGAILAGSAVRLVDLRGDPAEARAAELVDMACLATSLLRPSQEDPTRYQGTLRCGASPEEIPITRAALEVLAPAPATRGPSREGTRYAEPGLPSGRRFAILEVHAGDLYFQDAARLLGLSCRAGAEGLHANEPGFYGGEAYCGPSQERYYFFKVAIETK